MQQKTLKAVQKYVAGTDVSSSLFDEAQSAAFKEMLPYWAAFIRNYTPPPDNRPVPSMCFVVLTVPFSVIFDNLCLLTLILT